MKIVREGSSASPITLYDFEPTPDRICEDVVRCLSASAKKLPPKYFYDDTGARLFERIMELEEYYPTRTEIGILQSNAVEIAERIGADARLVEFGSGSGDKTWILLRHLISPEAYVPVDISRSQLVEFAMRVNEVFPALNVTPVCADYTGSFRLPPPEKEADRSVAFFPGSTLGNFERDDARQFLRRVRTLVGEGGGMLLGIDLRKDPEIMERAYNDSEGVTAEFNLNLLRRINRECGADFDLSTFHHYAFFDPENSRIEMRLVSDRAQSVTLHDTDPTDPVTFRFEAGEFITTEYSHKFELGSFEVMAAEAGWELEQVWMDERRWFAVVLLR